MAEPRTARTAARIVRPQGAPKSTSAAAIGATDRKADCRPRNIAPPATVRFHTVSHPTFTTSPHSHEKKPCRTWCAQGFLCLDPIQKPAMKPGTIRAQRGYRPTARLAVSDCGGNDGHSLHLQSTRASPCTYVRRGSAAFERSQKKLSGGLMPLSFAVCVVPVRARALGCAACRHGPVVTVGPRTGVRERHANTASRG